MWRDCVCRHSCPDLGSSMGGPQSRMSILRYNHATYQYISSYHVDFRIPLCCLPLWEIANVLSFILILKSQGSMSHVRGSKWAPCRMLGGQSGAAVTRLHGNQLDVGSNPAAARNEKTDIGQTPAQKVLQ